MEVHSGDTITSLEELVNKHLREETHVVQTLKQPGREASDNTTKEKRNVREENAGIEGSSA